MPYRNLEAGAARGQVQRRWIKPVPKSVGVFRCLIVSAEQSRREMFERAADEGGWNASLCGDARTALTLVSRSYVQLAVVDLDGPKGPSFHLVVERLAAEPGVLLIVCGNEGNFEEEVWVRQLGAWMYLPGVMESNNFALLCGEARQIAERLSKTVQRAPQASPAQRRSN